MNGPRASRRPAHLAVVEGQVTLTVRKAKPKISAFSLDKVPSCACTPGRVSCIFLESTF